MRLGRVLIAICFLLGCATSRADEAPTAPIPLEDRQWVIASYNDGTSLVRWRDLFSHTGWIRFAEGMVEGASACGAFVGTYRLVENEITLEVGVILAGTCIRRDGRRPANTWPLNAPVLNALNGTRTIIREEDGLVLRDASGQPQIVLTSPETTTP